MKIDRKILTKILRFLLYILTIYGAIVLDNSWAEELLIEVAESNMHRIKIRPEEIVKIGLNEKMGASVGVEFEIPSKYQIKLKELSTQNIGKNINILIGKETIFSGIIYEPIDKEIFILSYPNKEDALKVIKKFKPQPDYHIKYSREELKQAESYLKPAKNPNYQKSLEALDAKNYDEAEKWAKKAIQSDPDEPSHYNWLGYIYFEQKNLTLALDQLKKAKSLSKEGRKSPGIYLSIGEIYTEFGDDRNAIKIYNEYLSKNGDYLLINEALAKALEKTGDLESALKQFTVLANSEDKYFKAIGNEGIKRIEKRH